MISDDIKTARQSPSSDRHTSTMEPIETLAQEWLEQDKDEQTRAEIDALLSKNDTQELENRLRKRIAFGTAGLRSAMKAGFAHMNSLTVLQASQGLAEYILQQHPNTPPDQLSVAVGFDARYNSEKFARLAAAAFLAAGLGVLWYGQIVHTPCVPFAVDNYHAAAGVMVTASHNPKIDNGYKVYWSNGSQIIPPHDTGIAAAIDAVQNISTWDTSLVDTHPNVHRIYSEASEFYIARVRDLVSPIPPNAQPLPFTYTAMHGVGLPWMRRVARLLNLTSSMHEVSTQVYPDPEFPTVPFPNPEEAGALALAMQTADANHTTLILANDPDADRFSAAQKLHSGTWHQFTGNQLGILFAAYILSTHPPSSRSKLAMLASTVSSRMLASMAQQEGIHYTETLTGFKWIGNTAQTLQTQGLHPIFAFEEAIGYMFPSVVFDKDGIAAAAVFLTACRAWHAEGLTPYDKLQQLYATHGYFVDANTYLISPSPEVTARVFTDIRTLNAGCRPTGLGKRNILRWRDLTTGVDSGTEDARPDLPVDGSAQMITCELENVVLTVRGSGTEPKIKLYIEAKAAVADMAKVEAGDVLKDLLEEWFRLETYGLRLART